MKSEDKKKQKKRKLHGDEAARTAKLRSLKIKPLLATVGRKHFIVPVHCELTKAIVYEQIFDKNQLDSFFT